MHILTTRFWRRPKRTQRSINYFLKIHNKLIMNTTFENNIFRIIFLIIIQNVLISAVLTGRSLKKTDRARREETIDSSSSQIQFGEDGQSKSLTELCPGKAAIAYRFDQKARKCSQIGTQGSCGKNMIFYSFNDSSTFGHCDCDYNTKVPSVYHPMTNRCYFVYQQAYCKYDEWLELDRKTGKPSCTPNKCFDSGRTTFGAMPLASRDTKPEYVPLNGNGECVKLNEPYETCKEGEVVKFRWPKKLFAQCNLSVTDDDTINIKHSSVPALQCEPGSYLTIVGRCQPDFDFD